VTFSNRQAYQVAVANWTAAAPFVLITYNENCGTACANGEHGFVIVESISSSSPNSLSIQLNITHTYFGTAVGSSNNVTVDIGSYSPSGNGSFNTTPSSAGNKSTNSTAGNSTNSALDDTFDQDLDDSLGPYISLSNSADWSQLLPDVSASALPSPNNPQANQDGFPSLSSRRRSLQKREFFSSVENFFTGVADEVAG
jgi:hypothetical protein